MFGPEAVNVAKLEEEGEYDHRALVWGIDYDTVSETLSYPEPKISKLRYLVNSPPYAWGCTKVGVRDVQ